MLKGAINKKHYNKALKKNSDRLGLKLCNMTMLVLSLGWWISAPGNKRMLFSGNALVFILLITQLYVSVISFSQVSPTSERLLSLPFEDLCQKVGGSGKAKMVWEYLRQGIDPLQLPIGEGLSIKARTTMHTLLNNSPLIPTEITTETLSECGTRKLLQRLQDGQFIESVLIPAYKYDRTTLCVSTQIGCDRGCAFCLTGTMGLIRNLTAGEIIGQVVRGLQVANRENMPPMTNVVLMGMGDAGRNTAAVGQAVACLADRDRMAMAQQKITISTVGPSPETFQVLADMPGTLAWSLHAVDDQIRRRLVPSTRHTTVELRDGLVTALLSRESLRSRTIMIAATLISGINDSDQDAQNIVDFISPIAEAVPKIVVDLIPYNDIDTHGFVRPTKERVNSFQKYLRDRGVFTSVRVTRGDAESSACGMLATKRLKSASSSSSFLP